MINLILITLNLLFALPTPPPLEGWEPWLQKDAPELNCPYLNQNRQCIWMGTLAIDLRNDGAEFLHDLHVDNSRLVPIVGGTGQWPYSVLVNGQITAVIERAGRPFVHLDAGTHQITGLLDWNTPPSSLQVPKGIAQIKCQSNGQVQQTEYRTTEGVLRIGEDVIDSQVNLRVLRRIVDGHPSTVETQIWLTSTGGHQPIDIGNPFLAETHPLKIDSRLGTQLTDTQSLVVQPLPGEHLIRIYSLFPKAPSELRSLSNSELWPDIEHWIFVPDPKFRTLQVSGAATVDRERASLPVEWNENNVYQITPQSGLMLNE
ncbi:MAG: hypothetical protein VXZ96_12265, partial [Myxococcota bacterium]|nr:hypothetical protein [Myxococcota bacterium]